jgi:hypothetical protein
MISMRIDQFTIHLFPNFTLQDVISSSSTEQEREHQQSDK